MSWPCPQDCDLDFSDFERGEPIEITSPESEWITEEEHAAQVQEAVQAWLAEEGLSNGNDKQKQADLKTP